MAKEFKTEKSPRLSARQVNWILAICLAINASIPVLAIVLALT